MSRQSLLWYILRYIIEVWQTSLQRLSLLCLEQVSLKGVLWYPPMQLWQKYFIVGQKHGWDKIISEFCAFLPEIRVDFLCDEKKKQWLCKISDYPNVIMRGHLNVLCVLFVRGDEKVRAWFSNTLVTLTYKNTHALLDAPVFFTTKL